MANQKHDSHSDGGEDEEIFNRRKPRRLQLKSKGEEDGDGSDGKQDGRDQEAAEVTNKRKNGRRLRKGTELQNAENELAEKSTTKKSFSIKRSDRRTGLKKEKSRDDGDEYAGESGSDADRDMDELVDDDEDSIVDNDVDGEDSDFGESRKGKKRA